MLYRRISFFSQTSQRALLNLAFAHSSRRSPGCRSLLRSHRDGSCSHCGTSAAARNLNFTLWLNQEGGKSHFIYLFLFFLILFFFFFFLVRRIIQGRSAGEVYGQTFKRDKLRQQRVPSIMGSASALGALLFILLVSESLPFVFRRRRRRPAAAPLGPLPKMITSSAVDLN